MKTQFFALIFNENPVFSTDIQIVHQSFGFSSNMFV